MIESGKPFRAKALGILIIAALMAGVVGCGTPVTEWTPFEYTPIVAAGGPHTVGLKSDGTVVAAGLEVELAKWNLLEAVP